MVSYPHRRATAWFLTLLCLFSSAVSGQTRATDVAAIRARARDLHDKMAQVQVDLADGVRLAGQIVHVQDDAIPYGTVRSLKKKGIPKKLLIPLIVGGSVVVALCVAPYPIGFLCRQDPS